MTSAQFEDLSRRFGWIWGLKHDWHPDEDHLETHEADLATFDKDVVGDVWLWGCGERADEEQRWIKQGQTSLKKAPRLGSTKKLGAIALFSATTSFGRGLKYVAVVLSNGDLGELRVVIYRPPKNAKFWDFLQQYAAKEVV